MLTTLLPISVTDVGTLVTGPSLMVTVEVPLNTAVLLSGIDISVKVVYLMLVQCTAVRPYHVK